MNFNNIALPLTLMNTNTTLANMLLCNAILNDDYNKHNSINDNYYHSINNHKNDSLAYIPDKIENKEIKTEEVSPNIRPVQKDLLEENWYIEFCRRAKL